MKICDVTGRIHRTPRELAAELARIDKALAAMRTIEALYEASITPAQATVVDEISTAWYAATDAVSALERLRSDVEANPRPIPAGEAGTYALVKQNID